MKMGVLRLIFYSALFSYGSVRADLITINNLTHADLWVATYYKGSKIERVGQPLLVQKQSSATIERPKRKFWHDRELAFDFSKDVLQKDILKPRWRDVMHKNIGLLKGDTFFLVHHEGHLQAYTNLEWNYLEPLKQWAAECYGVVIEPLIESIKIDHPAVKENPFKDTVAHVRFGNELHPGEKECIARRKPKVKAQLEKILAMPLDEATMPKIAFVASGGGYRAMISTVGYLRGAQRIGLLDSALYMSSLSGSTWALCGWYATGLPLHMFEDALIDKMSEKIFPISTYEMSLIGQALLVKLAFGQPITLVDLYGALLANVLLSDFGDKRHRIYLSDHVQRIKHGEWPFPIYTAIRAEEDAHDGWYEFTPFEVGGPWVGKYVPTWAFGRRFCDGVSCDFAPEQSLGYCMGMFGSAFAARVSEIYENFRDDIGSEMLRDLIETLIVEEFGNKRLTYAHVFNFAYKAYKKQFEDLEYICLADGGSDPGFNLPYPVVSEQRPERKADVLIFLDMSFGAFDGSQLKKAENYARKYNLKFPHICCDGTESACRIYKDETDPDVPVVIYLPLVNDQSQWEKLEQPGFSHFAPFVHNFDVQHCVEEGNCGTFDLHYEFDEATRLSKLAEFNMLVSQDAIVEAIQWKAQQLQDVMS